MFSVFRKSKILRLLASLHLRIRSKVRKFTADAYAGALASTFGKCGPNFHIYGPFDVVGGKSIQVGANIHINSEAFIRGHGGLVIGDNVHIGPRVTIYTANHNYEGEALPYDATIVRRPVTIEQNVWIGAAVTIVPGITIGEGAVVAAGTVLTKDVAPMQIVGGVGARVLKQRDQDHYQKLVEEGRYGGVSGKLYRHHEDSSS